MQSTPAATLPSRLSFIPFSPIDTDRSHFDDSLFPPYSPSSLDHGTPTSGAYAQDGIWSDGESEEESEAQTVRPNSGATFGITSRRQSKSSRAARSRSNTITSTKDELSRSWGRKPSTTTSMPASPAMDTLPDSRVDITQVTRSPGLVQKKASKSMLKRRGDLSVQISPVAHFNEPLPPIPATPSSYSSSGSSHSPAVPRATIGRTAMPEVSPVTVTAAPTSHSYADQNVPPRVATPESKPGSSWKRGMQRLFKSKSTQALREAFSSVDPNRPPMPAATNVSNLPRPPIRPLGKPFASSTPPSMPQHKDSNTWRPWATGPLSPTSSTTSPSVRGSSRLPSQPALPPDPFSSIYDSYSNTLPSSPSFSSPPAPPKRRLSRGNSPSLRDLKNFITPGKPAITKAKSFANIRERTDKSAGVTGGSGASDDKSQTFGSRVPRRINSAMFLSSKHRQTSPIQEEPRSRTPIPEAKEPMTAAASSLPKPTLVHLPGESPPLMPPNPPYFPLGLRSVSTPNTPLQHSLSIDTNSPVDVSKALPAVPTSMSPLSESPRSPMTRSASGAVLLPRSRSTSMSLKSPPTSSSFFDLYEQLGIWPTSDKSSPDKSPAVDVRPLGAPLEKTPKDNAMSKSPSAAFSMGSWDEALASFQIVDEDAEKQKPLDFGTIAVNDEEVAVESSFTAAPALEDDESDGALISRPATTGSIYSATSGYYTAAGDSQSTRSTKSKSTTATGGARNAPSSNRRASGGIGGGGSGSNESSRPGTRDERRSKEASWFDGALGDDSESESGNDDDNVPLSTLHPEALAARKANAERKAAKHAARARAKSRNPGGGVKWDGEGGVPSEILFKKLEALSFSLSQSNGQDVSAHTPGWLPLQVNRRRSNTVSSRAQAPHPSVVYKSAANDVVPSSPLNSSTNRSVDESSRHTSVSLHPAPHIPLPPVPNPTRSNTSATTRSAVSSRNNRSRSQSVAAGSYRAQSDIAPKTPTAPSITSIRRGATPTMLETSPAGASSPSPKMPHAPQASRTPPALPTSQALRAASSSQARQSRNSPRSPRSPQSPPSPQAPQAPQTSQAPPDSQNVVCANAFVGSMSGQRLLLELQPETTAEDVLNGAKARGELVQPEPNLDWVVLEIFAERGYERQVREYERLQDVMRGWDQAAGFNCFLIQQSTTALPTWARSVPATPPFVGAYVQYETKRGKWSKRFLETRGGQVFLSKNAKNKEEVQINTLFYDTYTMLRVYDAPKPFVFVMKRVQAAATLDGSWAEYTHVFSAESSVGWKLLQAIYDARSFALAQTRHQIPGVPGPSAEIPPPNVQKQKPQPAHQAKPEGPLVDLKPSRGFRSVRAGFTGKGLLGL